MSENKVRFGLKNVHYAILTSGSYATPVAVPGAVNLDLSPNGETNRFYADDITYYLSTGNQGYEGSLEMAKIPDDMLKDVWGYTQGTTSKVLTENASAEPKNFALLYQISGDADDEYYVLYCCSAGRPEAGSQTLEDSKTPNTQSFELSAVPMSDGKVMAKTSATTPTATKSSWFTTVFVEA